MIYEKDFKYSIEDNDFNKFKDLIEEGIDPFAYEMECIELCLKL